MKQLLLFAFTACVWAGDTQHGSAVVDEQSCLECHTINDATAPDLAMPSSAAFTPSAFASTLWNHTPAMLSQVSSEIFARRVERPALTEADWADVFAYLYSERIFQFPASTRDGKELFSSKKCAECHSLAKIGPGLGVPVFAWKDLDDPVMLVYQMWNHASTMSSAMSAAMSATLAARKEDWPKLDGKDFGDLAAYVQYVQKLMPESEFSLPEASSGKQPFEHNCGQCHQGPLALETRLANKTFLDIGAGVWNHVPLMGAGAGVFPTLSETDMRKILACVWDLQYRGSEGNVTRSELAFSAKGCANCHSDAQTGAVVSPHPGKVFTPFSLAAIAWGSNLRMHREMWNQQVAWPTLSPEDVSDLVAFLNYVSRK
jgi:mono/diheme cytochrome c family protein